MAEFPSVADVIQQLRSDLEKAVSEGGRSRHPIWSGRYPGRARGCRICRGGRWPQPEGPGRGLRRCREGHLSLTIKLTLNLNPKRSMVTADGTTSLPPVPSGRSCRHPAPTWQARGASTVRRLCEVELGGSLLSGCAIANSLVVTCAHTTGQPVPLGGQALVRRQGPDGATEVVATTVFLGSRVDVRLLYTHEPVVHLAYPVPWGRVC